MFSLSFFVFIVCFYMCLFDCKCKNLKRLGENRQNTERNRNKHIKHQRKTEKQRNTRYPAHEPPRIFCAIYSRRFVGWIYCISVYFCFFFELLCFLFYSVVFRFRLVFLSFCIYNRTQTHINTKTNIEKLK